MNMIKNLIYDFGRVLVTYDFEHISSFGFASEEDLQSFVNIVSDPAFVRRCDLELIPFEDLIREMQHTYPQWKEQWQLFYDRYLEFVTGEMPGMHAYMTELKARGYKLYGLSNWCSTIYRVMKEYKIFNLLDGFVVSLKFFAYLSFAFAVCVSVQRLEALSVIVWRSYGCIKAFYLIRHCADGNICIESYIQCRGCDYEQQQKGGGLYG